jgi:hypothetical protein
MHWVNKCVIMFYWNVGMVKVKPLSWYDNLGSLVLIKYWLTLKVQNHFEI